jgi:hypothetical protein
VVCEFITNLVEGINAASETLRQVEEKRQRALAWFEMHSMHKFPLSLYTDEQTWKIVGYYSDRLNSKKVFSFETYGFSFKFNPSDGESHRIYVCITDNSTYEGIASIPLDFLICLMRWKTVREVLAEAGMPIIDEENSITALIDGSVSD